MPAGGRRTRSKVGLGAKVRDVARAPPDREIGWGGQHLSQRSEVEGSYGSLPALDEGAGSGTESGAGDEGGRALGGAECSARERGLGAGVGLIESGASGAGGGFGGVGVFVVHGDAFLVGWVEPTSASTLPSLRR